MEILVRLATDKYLKTGLVSRHSEAVARMLDEHCLPAMKLFDSNRFRYDRYVKEEVDEVFKAYLIILRYLYNSNSARHVKPGQKPFMSLAEFQDICTAAGLINERFTTREIDIAFNLAMMTHVNELDSDHHFQMTFVEFLEALARVAEMSAHPEPVTGKSSGSEPLAKQLENIMPRLLSLCPQQMQDNFDWPLSSPLSSSKRVARTIMRL
jgi:hypothetical protein